MGFWRSYLQKRIVRIYPMFIAALIIYYTLNYFDFETVINTALDIPLHLFLVKGESVFWSIPVELKYYVISPFVLLICHKFLKWNFVSVSILIAVCIMIPMAFHYFYNLPHNTTFGFLPVFFVGTFVAIAEILKKNEVISKIRPGYIDGFGTFCFLVVILTIPYFFNAITGENMNFLRPLFYVPYSVCWGIVLLAAKYGNGFIKWVLELKLLRFFGVVSYSIYLLHLPILVYINSDTTIPDWAKIYFFFGATVLLSSVTYVLIERPGLKINLFNLKRDRVE